MSQNKIRETRERLGISQSKLAAKLGVAQSTLSNVETNAVRSYPKIRQDLCRMLGATEAELWPKLVEPKSNAFLGAFSVVAGSDGNLVAVKREAYLNSDRYQEALAWYKSPRRAKWEKETGIKVNPNLGAALAHEAKFEASRNNNGTSTESDLRTKCRLLLGRHYKN